MPGGSERRPSLFAARFPFAAPLGAAGLSLVAACARAPSSSPNVVDDHPAPRAIAVTERAAPANIAPPKSTDSSRFAVVELFTSEGCSSCPAADVVANELAARASSGVVVLAFHVDYWDEIGWKDPFSSADSTARQQAYAAARGDRELYTPQMIVDGGGAFVGSDRARASRAIEEALASSRSGSIVLDEARVGDGRAHVAWSTSGLPASATITVAVTEDDRVVHVLRGENGGRTLRHDGVVRAFASRPTSTSGAGAIDLPLPSDFVVSSGHVVALASDAGTRAIIAAASTTPR